MAQPRVRQQPTQLESSTRIKRGEGTTDLDSRDDDQDESPRPRVEMKIPRGMPVLPGGRRMPPLPVVIRESLKPLRRSLAPLLHPLTTRSAERVSEVTPIGGVQRPRRLRAVALLAAVVAAAVAWRLLSAS